MELAHQKTEAVVLTKKWAYRKPELFSGGVRVPVARVVKYLGVTLDSKLSFTRHIRNVSASAAASAKAIGRLMPNVSGPSVAKRRLLASVVTSRLLYAAPVWATTAAKFKCNAEALGKAQRLAALRITRCYRTFSTAAALILSEIPPADLVAVERETVRRRRGSGSAEIATISAEARAATMAAWQKRWTEETSMAGWTRRVLPSVHKWIGRPPGAPVTYRMAQALTGHGAYGEYLHRFGIIASPRCAHSSAPVDDVKHTIFNCVEWESARTDLLVLLGRRATSSDVEGIICGGGHNDALALQRRRALLDMFETIMEGKENAERERQRSGARDGNGG